MPHYVYILRCSDGTFYTGWAQDPVSRAAAHNCGRGAKYTRSRRPVRLVYTESCESLSAALRRERELKTWPRRRKQKLIKGSGFGTKPEAPEP
ncbi:MAG TPA: GIY-YIG nuclease family protein [Vicinamibacterales bacterium]|nr:GIY-YIG nuclease family protein [Vicinamibacterales bacterium]